MSRSSRTQPSMPSNLALATMPSTQAASHSDQVASIESIDLYDTRNIEVLIRNPSALLGVHDPAFWPEETSTLEFKIRYVPLAMRNEVIEEHHRICDEDERCRLGKYVNFLKNTGAWKGMSVHFPNLQPDYIIDGNPYFMFNGDIPLRWLNEGDGESSSASSRNISSTFSDDRFTRPTRNTSYSSTINTTTEPSDKMELYQHQAFTPSFALMDQPRPISQNMRRRALDAGIDPDLTRYRGDIDQSHLENALCPEAYNCSVFISNIHPKTSKKEVFSAVFEGPICNSVWKAPFDDGSRSCWTVAVSLTFKEPQAAKNFLLRCRTSGVWIRGLRLAASESRDKARPVQPSKLFQTRRFEITGPATMDGQMIIDYLHTKMKFTLVDAFEYLEPSGEKTVQLEFDSIKGGSRMAIRCFWIKVGEMNEKHLFQVKYVNDQHYV
ncbi:hypothetical protein LZ554_002061 [Drepanopeziza brunnea f. sp. 'monogermtubi']|nr:hypothetical protein LZ554_002061 [Drepanopeziza brunnea f. sp. 'monogermtubi']